MSAITLQTNLRTQGPFSPLNMLLAGVSPKDVVWFRRLPMGAQMRELHSSERGRAILETVRAYEQRKMGVAMPQAA